MDHPNDRGAAREEGQAEDDARKDGRPRDEGERIAKVLARAGVASRREVERLIEAGRVALNGEKLTSPGVKVSRTDRVTLDGRPVAAAEPTRLFRYHKPPGLVTTHSDPQGRPTVFEALPSGLPRLISVGRLDLNSEGLLLLTNDGELARRLELPATGLRRRYRARARGRVDPAKLARLADGITIDGVRYGSIEAELEPGHESGTNQWIRVTLTEGKNREVRKVLEALGLTVNRLIRMAYGPYELGALERGAVEELPSPPRGEIVGGGLSPQRATRKFKPKPGSPTRAASAKASAPPPKLEGKYKPGWAKAKIKPSHAKAPAAGGRPAGPRGRTRSASPPGTSAARPPNPRPKGGPGRRG
ncbi:MAG TPA: pseudouridine synthase [Caulobacteraceae bacterium]|nr:pseudouridine synthase [Caulobacteraceae bacterium]